MVKNVGHKLSCSTEKLCSDVNFILTSRALMKAIYSIVSSKSNCANSVIVAHDSIEQPEIKRGIQLQFSRRKEGDGRRKKGTYADSYRGHCF